MADRAIVVGAGMVGLLAAYALRRRGLDVTIVEKGEAGMACSFGNAGFICPSLSDPLPAPGLVRRSLGWMLQRESPLYIRPGALPHTLGWLLSFWGHCNARDHERGLEAMLALSRRTLALYDALAADGVAFEMHSHGLMFAFLDEDALKTELRELRKVEAFDFPAPEILSREAALAAEPSLSDRVVGGILLPVERHVEPHSLSQGLLNRLKEMGVEVHEHAPVQAFQREGRAVRAVRAGGERFAGDIFVLAAGAWTAGLASLLGARLPIQAGKGYSITFTQPSLAFRHALYFAGTKAVLSPYADAVRIAGTMEFSGLDTRLDPARLRGLRAAVRRHLRADLGGATETAWTGMRPMTPDGLPAIGQLSPFENVFVSTGHGTNGIFMAPASGELLADLALMGGGDVDAAAFAPDRFAQGRHPG